MEDQKPEKKKQPRPQNVTQLPTGCPVESCSQKVKRAGFCNEHFVWFKEGLVSRKGERPKDFDKKYQAFLRKQKEAA